MPNAGQIKSAVDTVYNLGRAQSGATPDLVVFIGLNGAFNTQAVLKGMVSGSESLPKVAAWNGPPAVDPP
jgi:hypothetical protein